MATGFNYRGAPVPANTQGVGYREQATAAAENQLTEQQVDNYVAQQLSGLYVPKGSLNTSLASKATTAELTTANNSLVKRTTLGQNNGPAKLDATGKLPTALTPASGVTKKWKMNYRPSSYTNIPEKGGMVPDSALCTIYVPAPGFRYSVMPFGYFECIRSRAYITVREGTSVSGRLVGSGYGPVGNNSHHAVFVTPEASSSDGWQFSNVNRYFTFWAYASAFFATVGFSSWNARAVIHIVPE